MKKLLNEFLSYILATESKEASQQARQMGLKFIKGSRKYWSKNGQSPATHKTGDNGKIVPVTADDQADSSRAQPAAPKQSATPRSTKPTKPQAPQDIDSQIAAAASANPNTDKIFAYLDKKQSRISRMKTLLGVERTISDRFKPDQQKLAKKLKSDLEKLLKAHANGDKKAVKAMVTELQDKFKFYSNTSGTSFKTQAFGMAERHFLGKSALAKDLVDIFGQAGIDLKGVEDQDRAFKKTLSGVSKPDLGDKFDFKKSERVRKILSGFPQVPDQFKQLFGPKGPDGDLLDNTGGKNSKAYFEHSVANNQSLEKTQKMLESRGMEKMAGSISKHRERMQLIVKNWDKYTPQAREQAVGDSYATMAVELNSTKLGGDSELCGAIMKNLAEVNLYDQELAGGKEVYMPSHGSFPAADKLVRVKGGTKAERIDKISVKYGKSGKVYGMPAQSSTICLLHPDKFYHNLTGGRVGIPGYETGVNSEVVLTSSNWERMMKESGYADYIPTKQRKELLQQYQRLQSVIEQERNKLRKKNIKDIALMMKSNPNIEKERRKLGELTSQVANTLEQHVGTANAAAMRSHPMSFASLMTTHATIRSAKGFPDLLHCHQELEMDKFSMGIDAGDAELVHWIPIWREADERGGGLLVGFSKA